MDFKTRLSNLREDADLTQIQLAEMINVKSGTISKYENGYSQPNLGTLIKLADIFKVSVDYLLGLTDMKNPYSLNKLTVSEAEIISRYRRLSRENRIRIDERISAMLDAQRSARRADSGGKE